MQIIPLVRPQKHAKHGRSTRKTKGAENTSLKKLKYPVHLNTIEHLFFIYSKQVVYTVSATRTVHHMTQRKQIEVGLHLHHHITSHGEYRSRPPKASVSEK